MCLIEVSNARKPVPACMTPVAEGIEVQTHSDGAKEARADVLEFMLANHPLDCPICDKSGECLLQDNSFDHGKDRSRMVDQKQVKHTKDLGSDIHIWGNRCIACTRCVRFCSDVAGTGELTMVNRGDRTVVDVFPDYPLGNPISGNVVDLCPVGALISNDFLYEARVWYEKRSDGVCHECARGCGIEVQTLHNKVKRIVARHNPEVNDYWICDHGRFSYEYILGPDRWLGYRLGTSQSPVEAGRFVASGLKDVVEKHGASSVGVLASAFASNETLLLLRRMLESLAGSLEGSLENAAAWARDDGDAQVFDYKHTDGRFRISADRNPNRAGVAALLGADALDARPGALLAKAKSGELKALIAFSDIPGEKLPDAWVEALGEVEFGLVFLLEADERIPKNTALVPATAFTERDGSIINEDGQVQAVEIATQLPRGIVQTHDLLQEILSLLGARASRVSAHGLFDELGEVVPALEGMRRSDLGKHGVRLSSLALGKVAK
jgi:NADH-quinone oxidoreductase subunit G